MTTSQVLVHPPNCVVLILDADPDAAECVVVGTDDAPTTLRLTDRAAETMPDGWVVVFEDTLATPSRRLVVTSVLWETYAEPAVGTRRVPGADPGRPPDGAGDSRRRGGRRARQAWRPSATASSRRCPTPSTCPPRRSRTTRSPAMSRACRVMSPSASPADGAGLVLDGWDDAGGAGAEAGQPVPGPQATGRPARSHAGVVQPPRGFTSPFVACTRCGIGVHIHARGHACRLRPGALR
ncbi:MAG TPA: hypothetical protein VET24_09725 [Actinomycetota bacterium]|nr:hypothetical protein [Actinomycetota bacterium]